MIACSLVTGMMTSIVVVNADGSNVVWINPDEARAGELDWSPDGKHLVFVNDSSESHEIFVTAPDGSHMVKLTGVRH